MLERVVNGNGEEEIGEGVTLVNTACDVYVKGVCGLKVTPVGGVSGVPWLSPWNHVGEMLDKSVVDRLSFGGSMGIGDVK